MKEEKKVNDINECIVNRVFHEKTIFDFLDFSKKLTYPLDHTPEESSKIQRHYRETHQF